MLSEPLHGSTLDLSLLAGLWGRRAILFHHKAAGHSGRGAVPRLLASRATRRRGRAACTPEGHDLSPLPADQLGLAHTAQRWTDSTRDAAHGALHDVVGWLAALVTSREAPNADNVYLQPLCVAHRSTIGWGTMFT